MKDEQILEWTIQNIINNANWYNLKIEGDPSCNRFIIRDAHLSSDFSIAKADIMFDFDNQGNLKILFPEQVHIKHESVHSICPCFLRESPDTIGWQKVCPHIAELSYGFLYVGIPVVLRFVQNPLLCGIQGCDSRMAYNKFLMNKEDTEIEDLDEA